MTVAVAMAAMAVVAAGKSSDIRLNQIQVRKDAVFIRVTLIEFEAS